MIPNRFTGESTAEDSQNHHYVLGGGSLGAAVANRLRENGVAVTHVDEDADGEDAVNLDPTRLLTLETAKLAGATSVIVAGRSDRRNLLIAQLVRTHFGVERIVVLTNDPDRYDLIDEAGHDPVCATTVLSTALVESV